MEIITLDNRSRPILQVPHVVTAAWTDVDSRIINTKDSGALGLWVKLTINDSRNVRLRAIALPEADSSDIYNLPIQTVEPDIIKLQREYFEFDYDEDTNLIFQVSLGELVNFIKIQAEAGTVGATPASIDQILITTKPEWRA